MDDMHNFTGSLVVSGAANSLISLGNVGVGIDPVVTGFDRVLHIAGTNTAITRFTATNYGNTSNDGGYIGLNFGGIDIWQKENNYMRFGTNNTERFRILAGGNVGIGTSSPSELLEVSGAAATIRVKASTGAAQLDLIGGTSQAAEIKFLQDDDSTQDARIFSPEGSQDIAIEAGTTEAIRILDSGYVGIGTSAPTVALDVSGSSNLSSRVRLAKYHSGTSKILQLGADRDTTAVPFIGAESNHGFDIITNNTQRMRIDSSGNVGIGPTSPVRMLDIVGSTAAMNMDYAGNAFITIDRGAASDVGQIEFKTAGSAKWYVGMTDAGNYSDVTEYIFTKKLILKTQVKVF